MILQKEGDKMKKIRHLGLGLIIIMMLVLSFGCGQKEQDHTKLGIFTNVGFVSDMIQEDGKDYVEFVVNGGSLKLEVEDNGLFDGLQEGDFYKFAYDENKLLQSIEIDRYIEDLVKKSMEQGRDPSDANYISATDKVSIEGLVLLDSYAFDINGDGSEETISMYVNAEQGEDGEIYWDDGQRWLFLVEGQDQDYILFDDYVQLGNIKFHIYTVEDDFYITTIQSGTANLDVTEYRFDSNSKEFISTLKHKATGNVNMLHSSYGY